MQHSISTKELGPFGKPMAEAIQSCVHCGFCLAACPTYRELGQEMDSPRGRIVIMKQVLEGELPWEAAQSHIDRCLGCLACEPACPSGVPYRDLITPFRSLAQSRFRYSLFQRIRRFLTSQTIPFPGRFRWATMMGRIVKPFHRWLPRGIQPMVELVPEQIPPRMVWPRVTPAQGELRARVALLVGCAQQILDPDIHTATIEVLSRNGVEVVIPPEQGCCGGLDWHTGDIKAAQKFARRNLDAFPENVDAILTNAAGCGSAMHEYGFILQGTDDEVRGKEFCRRVMDVSEYLMRLGLSEKPLGVGKPCRIAYHDACHLANAQQVRRAPRELLRTIPGVQLLELEDGHLCCGSAGTYNLDQPEIAESLGKSKAKAVLAVKPDVVASGNIGCLTQLRMHLMKQGSSLTIRHTMQILRDAYRGPAKGDPFA